jgi:hypothetical protein
VDWNVPDYEPGYEAPRAIVRTREHSYDVKMNWRAANNRVMNLLNWVQYRANGRIDQARWVVQLRPQEANLNRGRFRLFQYHALPHSMECTVDRKGWSYEDLDQHRTDVFDWIGSSIKHAWNFEGKIDHIELRLFFSFEEPSDLMLFKLRWA